MNAIIGTDKQQLGNSSCRCNPQGKMLAIAIQLGVFSCRGYGKLVVALQTANPYLFARYSHETITDSNITNLSINGSDFTVAGIQPNRNIFGLGGGINSQFSQNIDWYLSYNVDLGDRGTNQNATGGLGFKF
jgi:outer membrane autotransporter protein